MYLLPHMPGSRLTSNAWVGMVAFASKTMRISLNLFSFCGLSRSQAEHEQHGLVAHFAQFRREHMSSFCDRADPGENRDVLFAASLEGHRWRVEARSDIDLP